MLIAVREIRQALRVPASVTNPETHSIKRNTKIQPRYRGRVSCFCLFDGSSHHLIFFIFKQNRFLNRTVLYFYLKRIAEFLNEIFGSHGCLRRFENKLRKSTKWSQTFEALKK